MSFLGTALDPMILGLAILYVGVGNIAENIGKHYIYGTESHSKVHLKQPCASSRCMLPARGVNPMLIIKKRI
jgi:hypothetical protein